MKDEVRERIITVRKEQSEESSKEKSSRIYDKLSELPEFNSAKSILVYISKKEEVSTNQLINELLFAGKKVVVPYIRDDRIKLCEVGNECKFELGQFGVLEPTQDFIKPCNVTEIDCIVVPGVAFDLKRNRLGHGGGYFDKLLCNSNAKKIGIAFDFQIVDELPTEEHDVKMDLVVTEERVIR